MDWPFLKGSFISSRTRGEGSFLVLMAADFIPGAVVGDPLSIQKWIG
jgi:hypothetical protein